MAELARLLEDLGQEHTTIVELVCGRTAPVPWTLYPGEYGVFDQGTRNQFYFHAHDDAAHEVGHFHTVRLFADRTVHLVAISMGHTGWPQSLFTLNLWAIGDAPARGEDLKQYVRRFAIDPGRGEPRVVRFVNLVFRAFHDEIERLQDDKLAAIAAYRREHLGVDPFADRSLEILSRTAIDVRQRAAEASVAPR